MVCLHVKPSLNTSSDILDSSYALLKKNNGNNLRICNGFIGYNGNLVGFNGNCNMVPVHYILMKCLSSLVISMNTNLNV